jgi:hypothetical protein
MGRRNPVTGQSVLRPKPTPKLTADSSRKYVTGLKPDGMLEIQLAQKLAQDTWRINRIQAVEENIFALGHSEP